MVGILVGFILFALPLALYFFEKGGIMMLPSYVWIGLGIVTMVVWVAAAVGFGIMFRLVGGTDTRS